MHFRLRGVHFFYIMMTVGEIIKYLEDWAPPGAAWEGDNIGLQIGSRWNKIKAIFLCLELNEKTLNEAISRKCNFIFTHHPLIFKPLRNITPGSDSKSNLIEKLIKNDISLYSAHTNLDFTKDGVNFELAKTLGLTNIKFLEQEEANQVKLVVFIPLDSLDKVSKSIFESGGGIIGEYNNCSFKTEGTGTFRGSGKSNPAIGKKEKQEEVEETRLEVLVNSWNLNKVIKSIYENHPYEEPAFDIYPLKNKNVNYGSGAIGYLETALNEKDFLELVKKRLRTKQVRYCKGKSAKIKKVAVHGGSISGSLNAALRLEADALVTSDIKYHTFQDAEDKILLIDAGHYETEIHSLKAVNRKLKTFLNEKKSNIKVYTSKTSTNPIRIYNY
jgi:dinuclear metal center YbgI/SA1388 family protein